MVSPTAIAEAGLANFCGERVYVARKVDIIINIIIVTIITNIIIVTIIIIIIIVTIIIVIIIVTIIILNYIIICSGTIVITN